MARVLVASFDRVPAPKGASQHILATVDALRADGHRVSLLSLGEAPIPGLNHLPLRIAEPNWLRRAQRFSAEVEAVIARRPFDVVHARSPWEGLAVPYGQPLIYEVNGFASIEMSYHHPELLRAPAVAERLRWMELATLDRAAAVVTPSEVTAGYLRDLGVAPERIWVVPNAPSFAPLPPRGPGSGPVRLVYHGTLTAWQGLAELLRRLPALLELDWTLDILTGDRRVRWLRKAVDKHGLSGRTTIHAPLSGAALGAFLAGCDVGLAPLTPCGRNLMQGCMPIKILDFMAAGLPVLAPDIPVVRRILGTEAPLYAAWSRTRCVEQLRAWITQPQLRAAWAAQGAERVATFSKARQADGLRAVYSAVLGGSERARQRETAARGDEL